MKNKIFTFAVVSLVALSITSCQKETKLDPNDGKELIVTSFNNSKNNIIETVNGDFIGIDIKVDSSLDFVANFLNNENEKTNVVDFSSIIDIDLQANYNLAGLRLEKPTLENSELFTQIVCKQTLNEVEDIQTSKTYQNGYQVAWLQQYNDDIQTEHETLDEKEVNDYAVDALKFLDSLEDFFDGDVPEEINSSEELKTIYELAFRMDEIVKQYRNKEITSQEIVDKFYKTLGISKEMVGEPINSLFVTITENLIKIDISTYFYYTQLESKKNIELSGSINYESWLNAIKNEFENDKNNLDPESIYYESIVEYYDLFIKILPSDVEYNLFAKINSNGQLTDFSYSGSLNGIIPEDITSLFVPISDSHPLEYQATYSGELSFDVSKNKVEVVNTIPTQN